LPAATVCREAVDTAGPAADNVGSKGEAMKKLRLVSAAWLAAALLVPWAAAGCDLDGRRAAAPLAAEAVSPQRLEAIEKALACRDWAVVRRALFEAAPLMAQDPRIAQAVLDHMPYAQWNASLDPLAVRALGEARGDSARRVILAYETAPADRQLILLFALGRMGREAVAAAPLLRRQLKDPGLDDGRRATIRAVLVSLGQATAEEADALAAVLTAKDPAPADAAATVILVAGGGWLPERLASALEEVLQKSADPDAAMRARCVLAAWGESSPEARKALGRHFDACLKRLGPSAQVPDKMAVVCSGLLLAAADPPRRPEALRASFLAYKDEGEWLTRESWVDFFVPFLTRGNGLAEAVADLVGDRDPCVAFEAVSFLPVVGPAAGKAVPQLLKIVADRGGDPRVRLPLCLAAAEALGMVARLSDEPAIRKLLAAGLEPELREKLEESLRVLRLEPKAEAGTKE
jgi:hypothetical protein